MKLNIPQSLAVVTDWTELRRFSAQIFGSIAQLFNGNISLFDNCRTSLITVEFTKANVDTVTPHSLNTEPKGYLVIGRSAAFTIYDGITASNNSQIYLRCSSTGTAQVLVIS